MVSKGYFMVLAVLLASAMNAEASSAAAKGDDRITEFYALRHSDAVPNELVKISILPTDDISKRAYRSSVESVATFKWADLVENSYGRMYLVLSKSGSKLVTEMPIGPKGSSVNSLVVFSPSLEGLSSTAGRVVVQPPAGWELSTWAIDQDKGVVMGFFVQVEAKVMRGVKVFYLAVGSDKASIIDVPFSSFVAKFARKLSPEVAKQQGNSITATELFTSALWCESSQRCFLGPMLVSDQLVKETKGLFKPETTQERHRDMFRVGIRFSFKSGQPVVESDIFFQHKWGEDHKFKFMSRKALSPIRIGELGRKVQIWTRKGSNDFSVKNEESAPEEKIAYPAIKSLDQITRLIGMKDIIFSNVFWSPLDGYVWARNLQDSEKKRYVRVDIYLAKDKYKAKLGAHTVYWRVSADRPEWNHPSVRLGSQATPYTAFFEETSSIGEVSSFAETELTY